MQSGKKLSLKSALETNRMYARLFVIGLYSKQKQWTLRKTFQEAFYIEYSYFFWNSGLSSKDSVQMKIEPVVLILSQPIAQKQHYLSASKGTEVKVYPILMFLGLLNVKLLFYSLTYTKDIQCFWRSISQAIAMKGSIYTSISPLTLTPIVLSYSYTLYQIFMFYYSLSKIQPSISSKAEYRSSIFLYSYSYFPNYVYNS